ncbi:helix-turn-helix domain-containing protein [Nocardiopsis sp. RSe5-2]|uniref:Helix-turn-helix domain-containing protein n=1 Tax=Nocardiopsis endophytica TaxID=3018445 RepID=A0ABT4TYG4_9ACTN|nr:helix-turn-helix domain-containing protein [Nocardiopsis endophytica]MDA2809285.1 helix-turn-helix domain-containing protein [Nocardiopsis endophytica]
MSEERIRVVVPVLEDCPLFELAVPSGVFGPDRRDLDPRWYELVLCGTGTGPHRASGGLRLSADHGLEAMESADLVVVPACVMPSYRPPRALLEALRAAHGRGARVAGLCTGAFVLAEAGLLDGREATTHWMYADELRRRHPRVRVDEGSIYVDEGSVLTSAGTAAAIDLCLHIVRTDFGASAAADVGRRMVVAPHREGGQSQFVPARTEAPSAADPLSGVLEWAAGRLEEPLTVADLAARAGMSTRTFGRRVAEQVGTTPLKWLNGQRLARARELLETTDLPVEAVAARTGLGTGAGLRQHFRRGVGTSPAAYRRVFRERSAG